MSNVTKVKYGNGKIDRTPPLKLLCFSKEVYGRLVKECSRLKRKGLTPSAKNRKFSSPRPVMSLKVIYEKNKPSISYEATKAWNMYDSDYWRWRRVGEYFREFSEEYNV